MRILHLVHQYMPDRVGGTELYTHWLTEMLSQRGHQVSIFYRRSAEGKGLEHRRDADIDVWTVWNGLLNPARRFAVTFGDPHIVRSFEHVLLEIEPDLVHIEHLMGLPVALVDALRRRGIPYVITLWDFWWVCANAQLLTNYSQEVCDGPRAYLNCARCAVARVGRPWLGSAFPLLVGAMAWRNHLLRRVLAGARALIAPTPFVRRWYAAYGAPEDTLTVIEPGLEEAVNLSPPVRSAEDRVRFGYVGGLSWQKGLHTLIEAFSGVNGAAELWIAGDETFDPAYVARLRAQSTPQVRFLGRLTREEVWQTLAQVDVVTVPTLWYETFSFIISEAFMVGAPVIASRLGPLADRVRDGTDGVLVPPGDVPAWREALQRIVDDRAWLRHLQGNVSAPCTLDEHADQIVSLYGNA
jgi:glycosyltransferase involved in cell wall biosynthesis